MNKTSLLILFSIENPMHDSIKIIMEPFHQKIDGSDVNNRAIVCFKTWNDA